MFNHWHFLNIKVTAKQTQVLQGNNLHLGLINKLQHVCEKIQCLLCTPVVHQILLTRGHSHLSCFAALLFRGQRCETRERSHDGSHICHPFATLAKQQHASHQGAQLWAVGGL